MSDSSILGGTPAPRRVAGRDTEALGPSDSSDSGSDVQGERPMPTRSDQPDEWGAVPVDVDADSDRTGTGERASATGSVRQDADILPDRIVDDPTLVDRGMGESAQQVDLPGFDGLPDETADEDEDDSGDDEALDPSRRAPPR